MRMYQFLIEENNQLKKDIYMIQRQNINQSQHNLTHLGKNESFLIKEEKSMNDSEYKSKSVLDCSKGEQTGMVKAHPPKEKGKEKRKIPSGKTKK